MNRTVSEHIRELEDRIKQLNEEVMGEGLTLANRNQIEAEIRVAQMALSHYRSAIELGRRLSGVGQRQQENTDNMSDSPKT